jgi:AcrR family transcriptional regulator
MLAFWSHGYEGTSMTQLVEAMGIGSPSIYGAFGSKEELFREAVDLYITEEASPVWQALEQTEDTRLAIQTLLFAAIDAFAATDPPRGCLIVLGAAHMGGADEAVRSLLREQRRQFHNRLESRIRRGITNGDLNGGTNPSALAGCVIAFFAGLAIEAVDGIEKATLRDSAELFCTHLFGR